MDETDASHEQVAPHHRHQAQLTALANAVLESFHASLKKDLIHRRSWPTKAEARTAVFNYIEAFYNRRRRHSTLGMLSPADFETSTLKTDGASLAASRLASTNKIMFTSTSTAQAA
jgi:transposase InsO family protein